MRTKPLQGKVAAILSERELVINIGTDHGVTNKMKFKVLAEPAEITDPDIGEILATIEREKVRVQATEAHNNYSIRSTYRVTRIEGGQTSTFAEFARGIATLSGEPRTVCEALRIEESSLAPSLSEEESYVKRGDKVMEILESG